MALRETLVKRVTPQLEPGEQVQAVFVAQTASQLWAAAGLIVFALTNRYHVVVATDRRIALFAAGRVTMSNPKALVASLPRTTRLGPAKGLWYKLDLGGTTLRVHKRFHKDIAQADAVIVG